MGRTALVSGAGGPPPRRRRPGRGRLTPPQARSPAVHIAIIGAGNVGGAVARGVVRAGHTVTVSATDTAHARALADEVGGTAAAGTAEAAREADATVLAVPYGAIPDVAREIADAVTGKLVIDATNPLTADGSQLAVTDRSGAEETAERLPGAHVVKAFNTVFASHQADPVIDGTQLDGFYAGDDEQAKNTVAALLEAIGYRPVDAGPLAAARALEHLAFLNISLNAANGWPWQSGWKLLGPTTPSG
ncbi:NADPH-dependent F420 reductase [Streptomyces naganishii]|uniref:NADPH-dependent F420 reductase n=1 Tax=Streptomyces naganishii TaxID=285447 RepID=UPI0036B6C60B